MVVKNFEPPALPVVDGFAGAGVYLAFMPALNRVAASKGMSPLGASTLDMVQNSDLRDDCGNSGGARGRWKMFHVEHSPTNQGQVPEFA